MENQIPKEIEELADNLSGSYWNYRWLKTTLEFDKYDDDGNPTGEKYNEISYKLHEVYYDKDGKPFMWSENPITFFVDNQKDMLQLLARAFEASKKPVLQLIDKKLIELNEYMQESYEMEEN